MKPSEQIKNMIPTIAKGRLDRQKKNAQVVARNPIIMSAAEERQVLAMLGQEPMTWVMGILTYLNQQAELLSKLDERVQMVEAVIEDTKDVA